MIEIQLNKLNRQTLYPSTLDQIEHVCDEYHLNNQFGIISMANQEIVEFLECNYADYEVNVSLQIENDKLKIFYNAGQCLFEGFSKYVQQREILPFLADQFILDTENKSVTLMFLVKPLITMNRSMSAAVNQTVHKFVNKTLLIVFLLSSIFYLSANPIKVLFIGNSYTEVNNLPNLIQQVANSAGDDISYQASTPGGCTFQGHLTQSISYIRQGGWDYVVLQEQSQLPAFPMNQFMNESYPYAQMLCDSIRHYNPDAQIVFYMTWGRKYGDQQNAPYFSPLGTYEGMDSLLYARYMMMAEDNHAVVSPVGALWHNIIDNHPNIELYQSDNSHPSLAGSYAAACSFYSVLFQKSPLLITNNCNVTDSVAFIIRSAAERVVYDSLNKWLFLNQPDTSHNDTLSISDMDDSKIKIYPNPVEDVLYLSESNADLEYFDICNISGRVLLNHLCMNEKMKINVSDLPTGLYIIRLYTDDNRVINRKFFKR